VDVCDCTDVVTYVESSYIEGEMGCPKLLGDEKAEETAV